MTDNAVWQQTGMATPKLNKALAQARAEIRMPGFDSSNPHFGNKFASLKACIEASVPVYAKHGIAVLQDLRTVDDGIACYTTFLHESGEERTLGPFVIPFTKRDAQGYASASTYARRYHLMGATVIVGDQDDDGNAASASAFKSKREKTKYYDGLKAAAAEDDSLKARELWDELEQEQQLEIWKDLASSSRVRSTLKKLLAETNETGENDVAETE